MSIHIVSTHRGNIKVIVMSPPPPSPPQVGDLMRSFRLLVYKSEEGHKLEEIAVDISLNPVFLMAIDMIDDETYVGADGRHIFLCQKNR